MPTKKWLATERNLKVILKCFCKCRALLKYKKRRKSRRESTLLQSPKQQRHADAGKGQEDKEGQRQSTTRQESYESTPYHNKTSNSQS